MSRKFDTTIRVRKDAQLDRRTIRFTPELGEFLESCDSRNTVFGIVDARILTSVVMTARMKYRQVQFFLDTRAGLKEITLRCVAGSARGHDWLLLFS
jgi:hypothetical protein